LPGQVNQARLVGFQLDTGDALHCAQRQLQLCQA
jgi:hypothetical protein